MSGEEVGSDGGELDLDVRRELPSIQRICAAVAACAIVGVVLTYATAWACVAWAGLRSNTFVAEKVPNPGGAPILHELLDMSGFGWSVQGRHSRPFDAALRERVGVTVAEWQAGWPFTTLGAFWREDAASSLGVTVPRQDIPSGWMTGISARQTQSNAWRRLPFVPTWPGFFASVIAWGLLAWGVNFGPGVLRRARRRRHGWCIECGYELGILAECPECGEVRRVHNPAAARG